MHELRTIVNKIFDNQLNYVVYDEDGELDLTKTSDYSKYLINLASNTVKILKQRTIYISDDQSWYNMFYNMPADFTYNMILSISQRATLELRTMTKDTNLQELRDKLFIEYTNKSNHNSNTIALNKHFQYELGHYYIESSLGLFGEQEVKQDLKEMFLCLIREIENDFLDKELLDMKKEYLRFILEKALVEFVLKPIERTRIILGHVTNSFYVGCGLFQFCKSEYAPMDLEVEKVAEEKPMNLLFSMEAEEEEEPEPEDKGKEDKVLIGKFNEKIGKMSQNQNDFKLRFKHFVSKIQPGREKFYLKNLGKIDHLYEKYGSEAETTENDLYGDPVDILFKKCPKYIDRISKEIMGEYKKFIDHFKKVMNCYTLEEMVKMANSYITYKKIDTSKRVNGRIIMKSLKIDFRYKIGSILLKDNKVYGYTTESIALQKYPPGEHLLVSLFTSNPTERPQLQKVSGIFHSADSFKVINKELNTTLNETARKLNKLMDISFMTKDYAEFIKRIRVYEKEFSTKFEAKGFGSKGFKLKPERSKTTNLLMGYLAIIESYVPILKYISSLSNTYYDIGMSIDRLARDCIKEMLNIESQMRDKNYKKSGVSSTTKYKDKTVSSKMTDTEQ